MAENNQTPEVKPEEEKKSRTKNFIAKHPRAARAVGITAVAATVVAIVAVVKSKTDDDSTSSSSDGQFNSTPETTPVTEA